jgi:phage terminase large subunit-like protein
MAKRPTTPPTHGHLLVEFVESFCRVPAGELAGQTMSLLPFQRELVDSLFEVGADGIRRYRRAFIGMPRGNGKSGLVAAMALFGLFDPLHVGAQVVVGAGDRQQARIIFDAARRMVELDPVLSQRLKVFRNYIEEPIRGGTFRVLSADAPRAEGLSISLGIVDEVHVQKSDALWSVLALGASKRRNSLLVGITTAGRKTDSSGNDSLAYRLFQLGRQIESGEREDLKDFYFRWWGADLDAGDDPADPKVWAKANPAYGILVPPEAFESDAKGGVPWSDFLSRRLNVWPSGSEGWLPRNAFLACRSDRRLTAEEPIVLGFDGSWQHDSTVIVGVSMDGHIELLALWEKRPEDLDFQVPIAEVEERLRELCSSFNVIEIAADPFRWAKSLQQLEAEGLPVVSFPQSGSRMIPATGGFRDSVTSKTMTWGGERRLAAALERHVASAVIRQDNRGARLAKESKSSGRRIDAAVAAVMALDRARWHASEKLKTPPKAIPRVTFID